jgi:hypothetical protein
MTGAVRLEILSSLASVREDVERQVAKLDRYRALKVIEQTISDFPGLDDLNNSLSEIRERMQRQIEGTREVRALRAVEKIMPDLSEVLTFLSDCSDAGEEASQPAKPNDALSAGSVADAGSQRATEELVVAASVEVDVASDIAQPAPVEQTRSSQSEPERLVADGGDPGSAPAPANEAGTDSENPPQTTISYGIAQFLNPPPEEAVEGSAGAEPRGEDEDLAQFRAPASSQEGRAA